MGSSIFEFLIYIFFLAVCLGSCVRLIFYRFCLLSPQSVNLCPTTCLLPSRSLAPCPLLVCLSPSPIITSPVIALTHSGFICSCTFVCLNSVWLYVPSNNDSSSYQTLLFFLPNESFRNHHGDLFSYAARLLAFFFL
jgi:hypothetical protein